jgi:hypothetical protein
MAPAVERYRKRNPEKVNRRTRQGYVKKQNSTLEKATRHYYRWTGPELELASREDLSAKDVALMIGRSYAAVLSMRRKLHADPTTISRAGIVKGRGGVAPA